MKGLTMKHRTITVLAAALLVGASACADLDVTNPNAPDRERALEDAGDLESLISGSFNAWWSGQSAFGGLRMALSTTAFEHSAWPANEGMVAFSALPRVAPSNTTFWDFYVNLSHPWDQSYQAVSMAREGVLGLEDLRAEMGPVRAARAEAFARFVLGLGHGTVALLYNRGHVFDETVPFDAMDPTDIGEVVEYGALMEAALGYLAEAARIARENSFELPASWMSREMTNEELAEWAHAFRAHFRAAVARTPDERAAVDWAAVLADVAESGGTSKRIQIVSGGDFDFGALTNMNAPLWSQNNYHYTGMADQSGAYQDWIATPVGDRTPFVVVTPDQRFPQGATLDEQREGWEDADCPNEGLYWSVIGCSGLGNETLGAHHQQAARGTWRWSNYRLHRYNDWLTTGTRSHAEISEVQLRLLEAEAHFRMGNEAAAVAIIDETRMENGGLGTAAANEDCVPRLPDGSCGNVLETLKWEWRTELPHKGFGSYYFSARGWGDLPEGTFLHLPMPALDAELFGEPVEETGGVGGLDAAPVGTYGF
jgi:hypothetical protein